LRRGFITGCLTLAVLGAGARPASAQNPPCDPAQVRSCGQIPPNALVVTGSRALHPVFKAMSAALKKETGIEIYYLYARSQCAGARQVAEGLDVGGGADVADQLGASCEPCMPPPESRADMWISDSPVEDCFGGKKPPDFREFLGPIAAYVMVVPSSSTQQAITMEEAYFVFGFGSQGYKGGTIAPWTDDQRLFLPDRLFGARSLWSRFLRLPVVAPPDVGPYVGMPDRLKGVEYGAPEAVIGGMHSEGLAGPSAIGLTTAQAYDTTPRNRTAASPVRTLAIRSFGQKYAFYPDSTPKAFDKRNVREGRYPYWAPVRMAVKVDITGKPLNARAEALINYFLGKVSMPGFNVVDSIVAGRLIPTCAMKVQRKADSGDAGELVPYTPVPGAACGCYMDDLLHRGASGCATCGPGAPCANGKTCSHGFCE